MEVRPGYKQTEMGLIPNDWDLAPLKGRVAIAHGFAFASQYFARHGPYRLTTPGHFFEAGGFRDVGEKQKYYVGPVPSDYVLQPGDVIVAMTEQADGLLGSAAAIPDEKGFLHNQRLGRVTVLAPEVELAYLVNVFNSPAYRSKVRETAAGTKVKHTSPEKLLEIFVLLPTPTEQRSIAAALSDVDALLDGLERLVAKKRDLKQAAMQQLITGQTRLPGFSGEWETKRLGALAKIQRGASPRPIDSPLWFDDNSSVGWVRISDVTCSGMFLDETTQRLSPLGVQHSRPVSTGSLIMSICATVGRPVITRIDVCIHDGFVVFDNLDAEQLFIYYVLKWIEPDWMRHGQTGSQMNLNTGLINGTVIQLPPRDEQTAIATVLSDMDAELTALEARRDKTRALKQAMIQELLTGRTRLV